MQDSGVVESMLEEDRTQQTEQSAPLGGDKDVGIEGPEKKRVGWDISKENLGKIFQREDKGQVIIFKKQISNRDTPLQDFIELLNTKPNGYWLLRESRVTGMISVSYKEKEQVKHTRFAFVGDHWEDVPGKDIETFLANASYEQLMRSNIADRCDDLLDKIFSLLPLTVDNIIVPTNSEASEEAAYLGYTSTHQPYAAPIEEEPKVIYNNPVDALQKVELILQQLISILKESDPAKKENINPSLAHLRKINTELTITPKDLMIQLSHAKAFAKGPHAEATAKLRDCFEEWLERCNLRDNLFCPVTQGLFEEPYYIVETGHVYDAAGIFDKGVLLSKCPLTQVPIERYPVHLNGYRRKLSHCLLQFFEALQLVKNLDCSLDKNDTEAQAPEAGKKGLRSSSFFTQNEDAEVKNEIGTSTNHSLPL
ncbi:Uncharacterised protein [Legionella lansingensis]|uniref:SH2 domain-containing protein n=1 Tax=Legionella lansingensis TaxID=45067 RepID=A0A0W0VLH9_9GAMM|nr:SH2 domain-containing protein [Legionella lansingensis]KTD20948.1 hypothetical protein Llan_1678 [Legionella lansingensis]SNV44476.1 Uncharacterised protein [Legionella lansingensis]